MNRKLLLTISCAAVVLISACSTREDFVVLNKSSAVIEVKYRLKGCTPETAGKNVDLTSPAKLSMKEFQKSDRVWTNLPIGQYEYDGLTCTFTVSVAPNEALLVDYAYNYRGHDIEGSDLRFDVDSLIITGAKGTIRLEGRQAQTQFKNESGDYVIAYQ